MIEFITGFGFLLGYFLVCAATALVLRFYVKMHAEVFRKILHMILLCSIFVLIYAFNTWWLSVAATMIFIVLVYPILYFAERIPKYSQFLTERKNGEIKKSLVVVFVMFAILISVCWGWLDLKYLVIASVFAWGLGDAAAALIGKRFGKYYIEGKMVEGRKSLEGTLAMFIVSFISVLLIFTFYSGLSWQNYRLIALVTAVVSAVVELYTKGGMDTLTCPLAAAFTMILLLYLQGGVINL
ncbi:MAG TPA: phosphatidate cytidylyltransferase [Clostridia bacterium]|nr:MAG: Cytidylyltransferase family protein [Firmicutes bacterium ADurb.Bin146]HOD92607.1 phosphatidate cytidylyltransferase [Clostridia bacterium]HQM39479.1 phosphatidate cytidylyltransferase [Clostridia bacterium]